jgi:SAM-dependent methyltransferase
VEANVLDEFIRHPVLSLGYICRRILQIPSRGWPGWKLRKKDDFDQKYGVDTFDIVRTMVTKSPNLVHGNRYQPSPETPVRWSIENCGMPCEETTFVDVGCGKGRVLVVAATYPFKRIVGVEYSEELAEICCRNLQKRGIKDRCEVVVGDAADFQFPDGDLMVFLYYPFDTAIYMRVLQNLATKRGRVRLANFGDGKDIVERSGVARTLVSGESTTIYEILGPSSVLPCAVEPAER